MNLKKLLENVEIENCNGSLENHEIKELSSDSRQVNKDYIYIALPGTKTDGHNFINDVIEKGCEVILCETNWLKSQNNIKDNVVYIGVKNTRKEFATISANFYENPTKKMYMVGVTGTNGKTTTTHIIENILKENNKNTGILGTLYARYAGITEVAKYTTPMTNELQKTFRKMFDAKVDSVIMEVSSHALDQYRVGACDFDVAVFTNLTQDHLDYHPTFDHYREAKGILFKELVKSNGVSIVNLDDPNSQYFIDNSKSKVVTYGLTNKADVYAKDIVLKMDGTTFTAVTPIGEVYLNLNLVGKFNVYNVLAALAFGVSTEISLDICKKALESTQGVAGRIEIVTPKGHDYTVVVDYAHTPDSLDNVLKTAREFTTNNLISVFGCGGDRDKTKRPIMGGIGSSISDIAVITSDNPRTEEPSSIIDDILEGVSNKEKVIVEVDRKEAIKKAIEMAKSGDTVVIAGKGHEDYQIFKDKTIHFDDREIAREFIKR
jgi:UDP-N-acetylmuramoyl-L-alanyl-D-glutamate--2,6-diaminopimelate ligase